MFGLFMTGVTVVAARASDGSCRAFTANSFTSVSLDPPLILVCLSRSSPSLDVFLSADGFSVSFLGESQREISNAFASRDAEVKAAAIAGLAAARVPFVQESLATMICTREHVYEGGDHVILIGRVQNFQINPGQPLGFFRGSYTSIGPSVEDLEQIELPVIVAGILESSGKLMLCRTPGSSDWEIPSAFMRPGERHGQVLQRAFKALDVDVEPRLPYSLFQEADERNTTLVFSVESSTRITPGIRSGGKEIRLFAEAEEPWNLIKGEMRKGVLKRYFSELIEGRFGIYFDTTSGGRLLSIGGEKHYW